MPAFVGERDLRPFVVDVQLRLIGEIIELAKFAENIVDWRGLSTENITTVIAVTHDIIHQVGRACGLKQVGQ